MSFKYSNRCYDTVRHLHDAIASDCPLISGGDAIQCTPSDTDILVTRTDLIQGTSTSQNIIPIQIPCDLDFILADLLNLSWQLALILIAGFAVRAIIKVF